ncbi:MAG: RtcB family protein, partial [Planctomycetota bacterium]
MKPYEVLESGDGVPVKAWTRGVPVDDSAREQLLNIARTGVVHRWVAAMPDVHWGIGATVGSVIPTLGAIIPAAVGVDIGCGMMAVRTTLTAADLPDDLKPLRSAIEKAVPHGRTHHGGRHDRGSWGDPPDAVLKAWRHLDREHRELVRRHKALARARTTNHLGTLGSGNHFIEICLDTEDRVWAMLHSGSRGIGNRIGTYFIGLAQKDMRKHIANLPDRDLAYFREGAEHFDEYVEAVGWAQEFARINRKLMMAAVLDALSRTKGIPAFKSGDVAVNCHHNYVRRERHYGADVWLTRKGAVRAGKGEMGIIPGSMGARSYIVRGLGHPESFESCSHGTG